MQIQCSYCGKWLEGIEERDRHQVEDHNIFKQSDSNITEETIVKFRNTMAKVKWILEGWPAARGDDRILVLVYLRIFEQSLVYNQESQRIELRDKRGLRYEDWRSMTSFETITRAGRKIRSQFKELQPSENTQAKREARERAIRLNIKGLALNLKDYKEIKDTFMT